MREYFWGAGGDLIARDDRGGPDARGGRRLYALQDASGSVSSILDQRTGVAVERYYYDPQGKVERVTDGSGRQKGSGDGYLGDTGGDYKWKVLWHAARSDGHGLYDLGGGGEWDYLTGGTLGPDPNAYADARHAYSQWTARNAPVTHDDPYHLAAIARGVAYVTLGWAGAALAAPLLAAYSTEATLLGAQLVASRWGEGYQMYGGAWGATAHAYGLDSVYQGWTDTSWATGADLGLSDSQRGFAVVGGGADFVGSSLAAGAFVQAAPGWASNLGQFAGAGLDWAAAESAANLAWLRGGGFGGGPPLAVAGGQTLTSAMSAGVSSAVGDLSLINNGSGSPSSLVFAMSRDPRLNDALEGGMLSERRPKDVGIQAPPDHHIFPQSAKAWFKARGINVDEYTITVDKATHEALHYGGGPGKGGGWWNETIMSNLNQAEAALGRTLTPEEVLEEGVNMLKEAKLDHLTIHPYNSQK